MKKNKLLDVVIMGFAVFAILFGAGNLIFPPYLGQVSGDQWQTAMWGFWMTDPILPVLGIIATALIGGRADALGERVSPTFAKTIAIIAMLIIGPFFAVPRTAATVHELAIETWVPNFPIYISSLVYFAICFFFLFNQSKVMDIIGKYLTPALLLFLAILIGKCIITPIGMIAKPNLELVANKNTFFFGFSEGYQTMDALGAGLTAGIVNSNMLSRGYKSYKERAKMAVGIAVIACLLLAIVYGGLIYVGATASTLVPAGEISRVQLLLVVSQALLGNFGMIVLSFCVSFACLTTATGLIAMAGDFFSKEVFNNKISYRSIVIVTVIISYIVSVLGTEEIIKIAVPMLFLVYPSFVVLIFLTLFDRFIASDQVYQFAILPTFLVSIVTSVVFFVTKMLGTPLAESSIAFIMPVDNFINSLPLASAGFPWLVPALIGMVLGAIFGKKTKRPAIAD